MKHPTPDQQSNALRRRESPLIGPTDLDRQASQDIAGGMNGILADVFALYMKTKNFHWHMSGPHFRDYHLLLDEQATQLYAMTDPIAERIRKTGGTTLRSIGHISRIQRIKDNDAVYVDPLDMLAELREDNVTLAARLREVHGVVDEHRDIATASLIETWIDETEKRTWFLFESTRTGDPPNLVVSSKESVVDESDFLQAAALMSNTNMTSIKGVMLISVNVPLGAPSLRTSAARSEREPNPK